VASQSFFQTCKNQIEKFKKLVGELWPYPVMAIPCFFALFSLFVPPHFSLEGAEPVYVALGVIAVMIVTIVLFCAEGFRDGLSLRGMVLLRESGIKELAICFFIFIACVPFLSHPKNSEVETSYGTVMTMSSDAGISILSGNISNVSMNEASESGFLERVDDFLLLLWIIGFAGWAGWSFWRLLKVISEKNFYFKGLSKFVREISVKNPDGTFDWEILFKEDLNKSVRNLDPNLSGYLSFFNDNFAFFKSCLSESDIDGSAIKKWISNPILEGLINSFEAKNDRCFSRILLPTVKLLFKNDKQLVAHYPKCLYERAKNKHLMLKKLNDEPDCIESFLDFVFSPNENEPEISPEIVKAAAKFLISIAPDFMGVEDRVDEFKGIYKNIVSSFEGNVMKRLSPGNDIIYQFNSVLFGYLLTAFKTKFDSEFFCDALSFSCLEKFKFLEGEYYQSWCAKESTNFCSDLIVWISSYKNFWIENLLALMVLLRLKINSN